MTRRFSILYHEGGCGIIQYVGDHAFVWIVSADYTERDARRMVELLNQNPELNQDELNLLLEAA